MIKSEDHNYFLSIVANVIKFEVIDKNNEIFFSKNDLIDNLSNSRNFEILENFLKNNIFDIEKDLSSYVKNINLVIEHDDFLFANLSMKYNFNGISFNIDRLNNSLVELKKYFQIVHPILVRAVQQIWSHLSLSACENAGSAYR